MAMVGGTSNSAEEYAPRYAPTCCRKFINGADAFGRGRNKKPAKFAGFSYFPGHRRMCQDLRDGGGGADCAVPKVAVRVCVRESNMPRKARGTA
jgi:hypothetical protein